MKLSGNKKNGRFVSTKKMRPYRAVRMLITILVVILAILVTVYVVLKLSLRPPPFNAVPKPTSSGVAEAGASAQPTQPPARNETKRTFVILGMDDGFGNTDTMMVATFDYTKYTLNVVSIPRDTLVNVSWPVKKANSFYAYGKTDRVIEGLTDLLGYQVDFYVKIDLDVFTKLVDEIGGVYFDVPKDMNYDDDSQDLHIHLTAGPQRLYGDKAIQLVRARRNVWDTGDIGRIETQQAFLKAAAEQILEKKDSISISALTDIFLNDVETNITKGNLGWLAKEFLKMEAVNVSFETIPANYYDIVNDDSYCTINVVEWLNVINTRLNPFDFEVKAEDLSILTRDENGELYVTNGVWAGKKSWGSGGSTSDGNSDASSKPSAVPGNESNTSPSDSPVPEPSVSGIQPSPGGGDSNPDASPDSTGGASPGSSDNPSPNTDPSQTPSPDDVTAPSPDETNPDENS